MADDRKENQGGGQQGGQQRGQPGGQQAGGQELVSRATANSGAVTR